MVPQFFTPKIDREGYRRVSITDGQSHKKAVKIARLVAFEFVINDSPSTKIEVDHLNTDEGDDRADNLEWVTPTEQQRRRASRQRAAGFLSSRYIGVTRNSRDGLWYSQVWVGGKRMHLGYFQDETRAARVYDSYVITEGLDNPINDWSADLKA